MKGSRLKLRDSKTALRTGWRGDEAPAAIAGVPRQRNVPWLFWNLTLRALGLRLPDNWPSIRDRAELRGMRLHDLRLPFAGHAAMKKDTLPMSGRLLGTGARSRRLATHLLMTSLFWTRPSRLDPRSSA